MTLHGWLQFWAATCCIAAVVDGLLHLYCATHRRSDAGDFVIRGLVNFHVAFWAAMYFFKP